MLCRCSKERIDGWAEPMLAGTAGKTDVPAVDNQVIIRRCDIDMSVAGTGRRSDYNDVGRRHAECSHVTTQKTPPLRNKIRDRSRTEERCSCPRRSSQLR